MLSGKYMDPKTKDGRYSKSDPAGRLKQLPNSRITRLKSLAEKNGMSLATLSLAWVASQPGITAPIIGARKIKQLEESVAACQIQLAEGILKKVDAIVEPGSNFANYYSANFGPNARPT